MLVIRHFLGKQVPVLSGRVLDVKAVLEAGFVLTVIGKLIEHLVSKKVVLFFRYVLTSVAAFAKRVVVVETQDANPILIENPTPSLVLACF